MDEELLSKQIGQRLRTARIDKKMSQADVAFAANLSLSHISDLELGKAKMSLITFCRVIEALQVSADEILRPNTPQGKQIYSDEFAKLLQDCTPSEIESIIKIVQEVKFNLHKKNDTD